MTEEIEVAYQYKYKEQSARSRSGLVGTTQRGDTGQSVALDLLHQATRRAEELFGRYVYGLLHLFV
jgi:hypothetical protein